jgi:hypothetical protein
MGTLPKGQRQRAIDDFPRFGLLQFQYRFPDQIERVAFEVGGDVEKPLSVEERLLQLPRTKQVSDLHCVTTWSKCGLEWSGVRFRDFYEQLVVPEVRPEADARLVVFRGQDGNRASLPLEDLLADDVLLADTLDGQRRATALNCPRSARATRGPRPLRLQEHQTPAGDRILARRTPLSLSGAQISRSSASARRSRGESGRSSELDLATALPTRDSLRTLGLSYLPRTTPEEARWLITRRRRSSDAV